MTVPTFCVEAFSRNGNRIIATVVAHMKSTKFNFVMFDEARGLAPQIAIVDQADRQMRDLLAAAVQRNPSLKIIYIVTEAGLSPNQPQEIVGTHLVSNLIPALERLADTASDSLAAASLPAPVPAAKPAMATTNENKVVQLVPNKPRRERLRALVVDDSPTVRMQLVKTIERMGMDCDAAEGGEAALAHLANQSYQIIFVDVVMPDMDGYKLTREIKRNKAHKGTPVIILTSKSSPFDRARGALAGCDTYLTKPVELKRLFEATVMCLTKSMAVSDLTGLVRDPSAPVAQSPQAAEPVARAMPISQSKPTSAYDAPPYTNNIVRPLAR